MSRQFEPSRLRLARRLRGLSQTKLAKDVGLSPPAINQFETGSSTPAEETQSSLSIVLKVRPGYFARAPIAVEGDSFFRSLVRVPAGERDRAHAYALALADIVSELEGRLELPPVSIEPLAIADEATRQDEIEDFAARARAVWGVPPGPIANVTSMAESRGVVTAAVGDFHDGLDAFSVRGLERPIVVLCSAKGVATRRRFDLAHELAHLSLHQSRPEKNRWQEAQAHRFASALLMPQGEIEDFLPRRGDDLRTLERVAKDWGVSMQAALRRAHDLEVVTETEYRRGMRRISQAGWRRREPLEVGPPERPQLLLRASQTLEDAGVSIADLAGDLGLPTERLRRMLSLPESRDDSSWGELVELSA